MVNSKLGDNIQKISEQAQIPHYVFDVSSQ